MAVYRKCSACKSYGWYESWGDECPECEYEAESSGPVHGLRLPDYEGVNADRPRVGKGHIEIYGKRFPVRSKKDIIRAHDAVNRHFERTGQERRVRWVED